MKQSDIENSILHSLYEAFSQGVGAVKLHKIREKENLEENIFWKAVDHLSHQGLIIGWTAGRNYKITSDGVLYAEENGIAPEDLSEENQRTRIILLDILAKDYEEADPSLAGVDMRTLLEKTGLDEWSILNNLQVLKDVGYIEDATLGYKITSTGLEAVKQWRQRSRLVDEFERISKLSPQSRGRAFQKLFAQVVEKYGWSQKEGVRTSHEEMDVIFYKEREYYLAECKWEKSPIEASVIRELYGKLNNRIGIQGMVVSMSGFASGAVKQAEDYANSRVILFVGSEDVHSLLHEKSSFDTLLNEKYQQLITQRRIIFS